MKNPLTYWKYIVVVCTVNAAVFIGYKLKTKYKKMNKLNEKDETVIVKNKVKEENDEKGKK